MVTYKTKNTVITDALDPASKETAYASIDVITIDENSWIASGEYYTLDQDNERNTLQDLIKGFTAAEVSALEKRLAITAKDSPEAINKLIVAAMPIILGQEKIFGLTANDWEKV